MLKFISSLFCFVFSATAAALFSFTTTFSFAVSSGTSFFISSRILGIFDMSLSAISSTFALLSCIIIPVMLLLVVIILSCDTYHFLNASAVLVTDLDEVLMMTIVLVCTTFIFKLIGNF